MPGQSSWDGLAVHPPAVRTIRARVGFPLAGPRPDVRGWDKPPRRAVSGYAEFVRSAIPEGEGTLIRDVLQRGQLTADPGIRGAALTLEHTERRCGARRLG